MARSDYHERQKAKRLRLEERAARADQEGQAAYKRADRIAKSIPIGQPILVGHHSERGHRADLKRIDNGMRRSIERRNAAAELRRRAGAVGTAGISSDDPEAVQKLRAKLDALEARHAWMKCVNAVWRAAGKPEPNGPKELWDQVRDESALDDETLAGLRLEMARRWAWQPGAPFPAYALSNQNAEMRRVKLRIQTLEKDAKRPAAVLDHDICRVVENVEENRIQLLFDAKPPEKTRDLLKTYGFRWSPLAGAWQRHLNDAGRIRCVIESQLVGGDDVDGE